MPRKSLDNEKGMLGYFAGHHQKSLNPAFSFIGDGLDD
jgi:hypothetical protein